MNKTSIACIALNDSKVFIARRNPVGQMGNRWEFPGGKVEEGESDETAIVREMSEEFGVTVKVLGKITESTFEHSGNQFMLHVYHIEFPHDGEKEPFVLTEHSGYKWVNFSEIKKLDFVDSDLLVYEDCRKYAENVWSGK